MLCHALDFTSATVKDVLVLFTLKNNITFCVTEMTFNILY